MTTTDRELTDHAAAGSLADELPYWGWLPDNRTLLTRPGELVTPARLSPAVVDGHTPDQLDAILHRWQRMLSGIDARTRIYFYFLRRPAHFEDADAGVSPIADLGQRKRRAFLATRIQQIDTYLAWCGDPRLSTAAQGHHHQPWWKHYVQTWLKTQRNPHEAIYFREQIEDAAARFRQLVDASRTLVSDLTPLDILDAPAGSRLLAELINKPGQPPWGERHRERPQLAPGHQRTGSRAAAPPPGRRARDSVLAAVPARPRHGESAPRALPPRQRVNGVRGVAPVDARRRAAAHPRRAAPLLF